MDTAAPASLDGKLADPAFHFRGGKRPKSYPAGVREWFDRGAERGLTAPTWPREYGGAGLSREEAGISIRSSRAESCRRPSWDSGSR